MKFCMNCMAKIRENKETCPFCGHAQSEGVKSSFHLLPGTQLQNGRYLVGKALKSDGFLVTYIGRDLLKSTVVSIQEYVPEIITRRQVGISQLNCISQEVVDQYQRGLQTFQEIGNLLKQQGKMTTNIVTVYDCFYENTTGYLVTEHLFGQSVQELINNGHIFSYESARQVILAVLEGITSLHRLQLIHQDIHPECILIAADGQIKITVPGGYRYQTIGSKIPRSAVVRSGYSAEEQYRNKGNIGIYTDVYATAAILYHMVTGVRPQDAGERLHQDILVPPKALRIEMPQGGENALMNSLQILAEDRTASPYQFETELHTKKVTKKVAKNKPIKNDRKKSIWKVLLPVAIGCVAISAVAITFFLNSNRTEEPIVIAEDGVRVPNLCGKSRKEAEEKLRELGMKIEVGDVVCSELSQDYIVVQDPEAGYTVGEDKIVWVTLSGSTVEVMLPRLKGKKKKGAIKEIKTRNLNLNEEEIQEFYTTGQESKDFPEGYVLALLKDGEPVSEDEDKEMPVVKQGSQVNLKVSLGDYDEEVPNLDVPDLSRKTMDEATNALEELKQLEGNKNQITFALVRDELEDEYSKEVSAGYIIRQIGATAGEKVKPLNQDNSRVEIRVILSKGPRQIVVPDVKGMTKEEAIAELENAGFQVNINNAYSSVESGAAAYTSPAGDTEADEGSVITLYVSIGQKPEQPSQPSGSQGGGNSGGSGSSGGSDQGNQGPGFGGGG